MQLNDRWRELLPPTTRFYAGREKHCRLLLPGYDQQEIDEIEQELGRSLPKIALSALENWNERGATFLLRDIPLLLNSNSTSEEILSAGITMHELFPEFCFMLETTKQFGVVVDTSAPNPSHQVRFAGLDSCIPNPKYNREITDWTYLLPHSLDEILSHEKQHHSHLGSQLKQMFVCANGSVNNLQNPGFNPLEWLATSRLYELYDEIWEDLELDKELHERMELFREVFLTAGGDSIGYFTDDEVVNGELPYYYWDHETATFNNWTPDFATALKRSIVGY